MQLLTCDRKTDRFSRDMEAPYRVRLGETFGVEIADCFGRFPGRDLPPWDGGANPITGPIAVEGIVPQDGLAVELLDLRPVGDGFIGTDTDRTWLPIDHEARSVQYPGGLVIPLSPHVGTMGVAPQTGSASTHDAGDHGGNMDCKLLGPEAWVCFRAKVPGAGLGLGDVHAAMGDGEVGGQGVEVAAVATLRVTKVSPLPVSRPYGLQHDRLFVIGWGETLTAAADSAQADMKTLVMDTLELSERLATKFLGIAADLRVCWRGGRTPCMRMELPLAHLPPPVAQKLRTQISG